MNTLIGLLIIAVGSFGQSSSYVPIKKVDGWSWESFWLVQGIFAWLVFPLLGALLAIPAGSSLLELWGAGGALPAMVYGVLWGVGGLTFGLSMRYLGVALGQSIALGTCAGFGTLFPALFVGKDLLHGEGLMLLIGVCITLAGIAIIGYAGSLRSKNMTEEEKRAAVKDFALTKGLLVALLAGVMSACFALVLADKRAGQSACRARIEACTTRLPGVRPAREYQLSPACGKPCVYTFCMCPGGQVTAARRPCGHQHTRDGGYAAVVSVGAVDFAAIYAHKSSCG